MTEGVSGKQRVRVTKKTPSPVFQATEGLVAGREWVTRKDPLHTSNGEGQGWLAGRKTPPSRILSGGGMRDWLEGRMSPLSCVSSEEGVGGGVFGGGVLTEETPSISCFKRGRGGWCVDRGNTPSVSHFEQGGGGGG